MDRWMESLEADHRSRKNQHIFRQLAVTEVSGTRHIVTPASPKPLLNLASNDYLGLSQHPDVITAAQLELANSGTGATSSRLLSGHRPIHHALERALADWHKKDDALLFSSGYTANIGVISALASQPGTVVYSDTLNHASTIDGCRLSRAPVRIFRHCDHAHLATLLSTDKPSKALIITEGIFSMDGDIAPLAELSDLAMHYGALLLVDDAHGMGVTGPTGAGSTEAAGLSGEHIVHIGTLSKALGSQGGYIAANHPIIEFVTNHARSLIYSTGLSPASTAAAYAALQIAQNESGRRAWPFELAGQFRSLLTLHNIVRHSNQTQITPIFSTSTKEITRLSAHLRKNGLWAPAIRPPTVPPGTGRIRIAWPASHTRDDVHRTAAIVIASLQLKE